MNDLIILATLLAGPKHGYQVKREAGAVLGQDILHNNIVYPLLHRFTEQGWVRKKTVPGERGQMRHQYAITPLGRRMLIERLSEYGDGDARSPEGFLTRVGLFQMLDPKARQNILDRRRAELEKKREHLIGIQQRFPLDRYAREATCFLQEQVESELGWIQSLRKISQ